MDINKLRFIIPYYDKDENQVFYYDEENNYKPISIFSKIGLDAKVTDYLSFILPHIIML